MDYAMIEEAARRAASGPVLCTPMEHSAAFSEECGGDVWLKCEHRQLTGSFKMRGAWNSIRGGDSMVVAASAGNHAQGVAYAAKYSDTPCTIVMPKSASPAKVSATRRYGADVILHGNNYEDAARKAGTIQGRQVHAFDDYMVMAGQGVIGLEILEQLPEVERVCMPAGGGGLLAGVSMAIKHTRPDVEVVGVRTTPGTISDGTAVSGFGERTSPIVQKYADSIVTISDDHIVHAMFMMLERHHTVVEPAGAASMAHLMESGNDRRTVCVVSGGNIDMWLLGQVVNHGLAAAGRLLRVMMTLPDKPGIFSRIMGVISESNANLVDMEHDRLTVDIGRVSVILTIETAGREDTRLLVDRLEGLDPQCTVQSMVGSTD